MGGHVIVTGGAGGIGTQTVRDLIGLDYRVSAIDLSREALDRLQTQLPRAGTYVADLTNSASAEVAVDAAVEAFGTPYGLINLAGNNRLQPMEEVTDETWRFLLDVNLSSAFYMCRKIMPMMKKAGGRVVNTSSISGIRKCENQVAYAAAKAGVVGMTRALATEYARYNVTVNAVAPVAVLTERVAAYSPAHLQAQLDMIPMGRFSSERDVSSTFTFLMSEDAGFFTGQTFSPNGGDLMP